MHAEAAKLSEPRPQGQCPCLPTAASNKDSAEPAVLSSSPTISGTGRPNPKNFACLPDLPEVSVSRKCLLVQFIFTVKYVKLN